MKMGIKRIKRQGRYKLMGERDGMGTDIKPGEEVEGKKIIDEDMRGRERERKDGSKAKKKEKDEVEEKIN